MDPALFIRGNTAIAAPPLVPEIRLHLATEVTPIWQATEETLARDGLPPPFWAFAWAGGQALARYLLDHPGGGRRPRGARFRLRLRARRDRRGQGRRGAGHRGRDRSISPPPRSPLNAALNGVDGRGRRPATCSTRDAAGSGGCHRPATSATSSRWRRARSALAAAHRRRAAGGAARRPRPRLSAAGGLCEVARYDVPISKELEGPRAARWLCVARLPR